MDKTNEPEDRPVDSQNESPWLETLTGEQRDIARTMLEAGMTKGEIEAELENQGHEKE